MASTQGPSVPSQTPWYNHPTALYTISILLLTIAWTLTSVRIFTRLFITKIPGWDDLFAFVALLMFTQICAAVFYGIPRGLGIHIHDLPPDAISHFLLTQYIFGSGYTTATSAIKLSILFQYTRVFKNTAYTLTLYTIKVVAILVGLWGAIELFLNWLPCLPHPDAWWTLTGKGCYGFASSNLSDGLKFINSHAALNIFFDLIVFGLAFRLQFAHDISATKRGARLVLCVGILSFVFAVWRLINVLKIGAETLEDDPTFIIPQNLLITIVEIFLACVYASVPFFNPIVILFKEHVLNKIFVMYEFNVSTESRFQVNDQYDEIELAHAGSLPAGTAPSIESKHTNQHYADSFIQRQVTFLGDSEGKEDLGSSTIAKSTA